MTKYEQLREAVNLLAEELFSETDVDVIDLPGLPDSSITGMRLIRPSPKEGSLRWFQPQDTQSDGEGSKIKGKEEK